MLCMSPSLSLELSNSHLYTHTSLHLSLSLSLLCTHYFHPNLTLFNVQAERHTEQFRLIGSSTENMLKELRERSAASKAAQEMEVARYVWMDS